MKLPFLKANKKKWRLAALTAVIFLVILVIGACFLCKAVSRRAFSPRSSDNNDGEKSISVNSLPAIDPAAEKTNEQEFTATVEQLDSSDKLVDFIKKDIKITNEENQTALPPSELFSKKSGGPQDIAVFAAYVLNSHSFEAGVLEYAWTENAQRKYHAVAVFRDKDLPKYLVATPEKVELVAHGWSFKDLLNKEEGRTGVIIEEYAFFNPGQTDLTTNDWTKNQ